MDAAAVWNADTVNNNTLSSPPSTPTSSLTGVPVGSGAPQQPWVHFVKCPDCGFTTLNLTKFESHFPCALRSEPPKYFTYVCSLCQAVSTSREIMEDHKEIYHKKVKVNIIECCDTVKRASTSSGSLLNGDINHNTSTSSEESQHSPNTGGANKGIPCPFCKSLCQSSDDLTAHIQFLHFAISPLARMPPGHPFSSGMGGLGDMSWPPSAGMNMGNPPCPICGASFRNFRQLEGHMNTVHSFPRMQNSPEVTATGSKRPSSVDVSKEMAEHKVVKTEAYMPSMSAAANLSSSIMSRQPKAPMAPPQPPSMTPANGNRSTDSSSNGTDSSQSQANGGLVHNTMRKTKSDMKVIARFIQQCRGDNREIHSIPEAELDEHLQEFVAQARKKDGHEYEPESLKAFIHSMERYLRVYNYDSSVLRDACFVGTRTALNNRLQELRALSRTTSVPKNLSVEHAIQLFASGLLGADNPQSLLNILWFFNRVHFCVRGTHRHKTLTWGQFQILTSQDGSEYLQFTQHANSDERRYYLPSSNAFSELPLDLLDVYKIYSNMRPVEARQPYHPFYLAPDAAWEQGGAWFKHFGAGVHILSKIPRLLGIKTVASNNGTNGDLDGADSSIGSPGQESNCQIRDDIMDEDSAVDMSMGGNVSTEQPVY